MAKKENAEMVYYCTSEAYCYNKVETLSGSYGDSTCPAGCKFLVPVVKGSVAHTNMVQGKKMNSIIKKLQEMNRDLQLIKERLNIR